MKVFHCDHCDHLVFFENSQCVACGHPLAYLPDLGIIGSLEVGDDGLYRSPLPSAEGQAYRLCDNYVQEQVCNWAVPADEALTLCSSCRLTQVIPDLSRAGNLEAWARLEAAKRRLVHSLLSLGLPVANKLDDPKQGLAFEFLADPIDTQGDSTPVLTGHANGLITISVAEAYDDERERRRISLHEPYRTLLGHFRHEVGHYYWDRLIRDTPRLGPFCELFGDPVDYQAALQRHYAEGPPADWQQRFVSAYSSVHPWEDWAETWAHYLHMVDSLETAAECGLSLRPRRRDEPALRAAPKSLQTFDELIENWFPLTYVLNNLNRSLGLADAYPFVLSTPAIEKLRFVHDTIDATNCPL